MKLESRSAKERLQSCAPPKRGFNLEMLKFVWDIVHVGGKTWLEIFRIGKNSRWSLHVREIIFIYVVVSRPRKKIISRPRKLSLFNVVARRTSEYDLCKHHRMVKCWQEMTWKGWDQMRCWNQKSAELPVTEWCQMCRWCRQTRAEVNKFSNNEIAIAPQNGKRNYCYAQRSKTVTQYIQRFQGKYQSSK